MKSIFLYLVITLSLSVRLLSQQSFPSFYSRNSFQLSSPGSMRYGLYGYDNPALLTYVDNFNFQFSWSDRYGDWQDFTEWGAFAAVKNIGFSVIHTDIGKFSVKDYSITTGFGNRDFSIGLRYGWSSGDINYFGRTDIFSLGLLYRPLKYFSFGAVGTASLSGSLKEVYFDAAIRPFGDEKIALFADYALWNNSLTGFDKKYWSAGAAIELIPGLRVTGRYFDTDNFTAGVQISLGNIGLSTQAHIDKNGKSGYYSHSIRLGGYDRNLFRYFFPGNKYLKIDLKGDVKYTRHLFFDNANTLLDLLNSIDASRSDNSVKGIVINTSGINAGREKLWELREALKDFKSSGKDVTIFIDRPSLDLYHFASVADKIVMDPIGMLQMPGYISGLTYFKGTAEKLGIGVDELRFFKYKSAAEMISREKMSEADREQRQKLLDGFYSLAINDICMDRKIENDTLENIINNIALLSAREALEKGLVDTLCRWDGIYQMLEKNNITVAGKGSLEKFKLPEDNYWGEPDRIAVIYAVGSTSLDDGINARSLIYDFEKAGEDPLVKAIVLRVDSPGGDPLASDYISEAIKKYKKIKPVIVSQGSVAASGGYYISMDADTIIAAPNTVTASIGVISAWFYNNGLKEKLGMTTDFVKKGEHADLYFGPSLPFIGIGLPDRPLTEFERNRAELIIRELYKDFITRVAGARNLSVDYVDSIGQGRVWSGTDALKLKLVDLIGGLNDAIEIAKKKSGIAPDDLINIVQYPASPLFNLDFLKPKFLGINIEENELLKELTFRLKNNGIPLTILPMDYIDLIREHVD